MSGWSYITGSRPLPGAGSSSSFLASSSSSSFPSLLQLPSQQAPRRGNLESVQHERSGQSGLFFLSPQRQPRPKRGVAASVSAAASALQQRQPRRRVQDGGSLTVLGADGQPAMMIEDNAGTEQRGDYSNSGNSSSSSGGGRHGGGRSSSTTSSSSSVRVHSQEQRAEAEQLRVQDAATESKQQEEDRGDQQHRHKLQRGDDSGRLIPSSNQSSSSTAVTAVNSAVSLAAARPALSSSRAVDDYLPGGLLAPPRALLQRLANFEKASNDMEAVFQTFTALGGVPPPDCEADLIPLSRRHQRLGFATVADMRPAVLEAAFMQTDTGLDQQQQAELVQQIDGAKAMSGQQELPGCISDEEITKLATECCRQTEEEMRELLELQRWRVQVMSRQRSPLELWQLHNREENKRRAEKAAGVQEEK